MALRFVLGRAGSGKTRYCLQSVAAELERSPDGAPLVLLVPEQASFQTDRALLSLPGVVATFRAQVLSFRRLAWRVLAETGGAARPHLDDVGKAMALRVLLTRREGELRVFRGALAKPGVVRRLAATLSELGAYGIRADALAAGYESLRALGRDETALAGKLHDLALLAADLEAYLAGRWTDPDDYLSLLAARLREAAELEPAPGAGSPVTVSGAHVWVDGFTGFTPQEMNVLLALARVADEVEVCLCLDPDELETGRAAAATFHPTLRTYDALLTLAAAEGLPVKPPLLLRGTRRFGRAPALAHLEREYPRLRPAALAEPSPAITLVAAESRRAEVAAAAREMLRLAREEGYRWREMAVITRSLDLYADLLEPALRSRGIPFFLDRRRPVAHHPLVTFLRAALETVLEGWRPEPLFRLLKTDLTPLSREEVDLLENYALAHGIRRPQWLQEEPWTWRRLFSLDETAPPEPADEERLRLTDAIRRRVTALLLPFDRALLESSGPRPARETAGTLWALVEAAQAPARVAAWRDAALAAGRPDEAQEHDRVLDGVVHVLDQLVANLGDMPLTPSEFARVLEAGLESLEVGLVPPTLDQVVVGSVDRSRQPEVRAAFVLGLNDGVFPAAPAEDAVFDDREREELAAFGLETAPSSREKALGEDYLVYVALTRPSERLWLGWSLSDDEGRALAPSPVVHRLTTIFPWLVARPAGLVPDPEEVSCEGEALVTVAATLAALRRPGHVARTGPATRPDTGPGTRPSTGPGVRPGTGTGAGSRVDLDILLEMYSWLVADPARRERARTALAAVGYSNRARLDPALAARLYGDPVRISVSRLEAYAACPFQLYASAGLALEPRAVHELAAPDIGSFYHAVLNALHRRLVADGLDLADPRLDEAELDRRLDEAAEELAPRLGSEILLRTGRNRYVARQLRRILRRTVGALREHARRTQFRPVGTEVRFDLEPGRSGVRLRGAIDRLEAAPSQTGDRLYIRVIDFKSSAKEFDLRSAYHGLDLQLQTYLLALERPETRLEQGPGPAPESVPWLPAAPATSPAGLAPGKRLVPAGAFFVPVTDPVVRADGPVDDQELAALRAKRVHARGFVATEPEILRLMGAHLEPEKAPAFLPVTWREGGPVKPSRARLPLESPETAAPEDPSRPDRSARTARTAQPGDPRSLRLLLDAAWLRLTQLAAGIRSGEIDIRPARLSPRESVCRFCDYRPVCRFDPLAGDRYRHLGSASEEEVWARMAEEVRSGRA